MVKFCKNEGSGVRGRVVTILRDEGMMRVLTEGDTISLQFSKCLIPVEFHDGIVCYDEPGCSDGVEPNSPVMVFPDGHWVTQEALDHAPKVDTRVDT